VTRNIISARPLSCATFSSAAINSTSLRCIPRFRRRGRRRSTPASSTRRLRVSRGAAGSEGGAVLGVYGPRGQKAGNRRFAPGRKVGAREKLDFIAADPRFWRLSLVSASGLDRSGKPMPFYASTTCRCIRCTRWVIPASAVNACHHRGGPGESPRAGRWRHLRRMDGASPVYCGINFNEGSESERRLRLGERRILQPTTMTTLPPWQHLAGIVTNLGGDGHDGAAFLTGLAQAMRSPLVADRRKAEVHFDGVVILPSARFASTTWAMASSAAPPSLRPRSRRRPATTPPKRAAAAPPFPRRVPPPSPPKTRNTGSPPARVLHFRANTLQLAPPSYPKNEEIHTGIVRRA